MDDVELTKRICEILGAIDGWAWREDGPDYTDSEVAVHYGRILASPHRAVGVRVYGDASRRLEHVTARRVQIRYRGAPDRPDGADELASAGHPVLVGLSRVGGISDVSRMSMAPLGADNDRREERVDNYQVILDNPEAST